MLSVGGNGISRVVGYEGKCGGVTEFLEAAWEQTECRHLRGDGSAERAADSRTPHRE